MQKQQEIFSSHTYSLPLPTRTSHTAKGFLLAVPPVFRTVFPRHPGQVILPFFLPSFHLGRAETHTGGS